MQEVGAICPDECALHIAAAPGTLACADGVVRWHEGDPLGFVPDDLLGDDPEDVKAGLRAAYARIAGELEFEALLLAHGGPMASGGREALAAFASGLDRLVDGARPRRAARRSRGRCSRPRASRAGPTATSSRGTSP